MIEPAAKPVIDMGVRQLVASVGPLSLPIPNHCSDLFAAGWAFADTLVAKGVDPQSALDEGWHHEKMAGFEARRRAKRQEDWGTEADSPVEGLITQHEATHD